MTDPVSAHDYAHERAVAEDLARQAAEILLHYRQEGFTAEIKTSGDDLVTVADKEASELIVAGLRSAFPGDGILSEELLDNAERLSHERVWIIDPIDGTSEYVKGSPDYCVSIGLSVNGQAVLGVVLAPESDELFCGVVGEGVWKNGKQSGFSQRPPAESVIAVSDTEHARELSRYPLPSMMPSGSIALKMARISAGEADATFTMSPRSEWDIAAGMALIEAAGGVSTRRNGTRIALNSEVTYTRRGILAGRSDVVEWLKAELLRLQVPEQVHQVTQDDDVWALAPQEAHEGQQTGAYLHLRHASGQLLAWALVQAGSELKNAVLERLEGDEQHAGMLKKDMVRIYGPLSQA
ncbi:3'(2'),5'-bisphosphate nucleotidase CysQ [Deinococcus altitudinis]|uniref:3'(2'),5'-bisphosphate nucleotidase CysQ n=1 Tax=Deinococcus altitudinis TaxID=468914 RepID=UPI0038913E96